MLGKTLESLLDCKEIKPVNPKVNQPDARVGHQRPGAGQGGAGCMLRVRTGPECPEDNLRELMWDSNPNCGIARERGK